MKKFEVVRNSSVVFFLLLLSVVQADNQPTQSSGAASIDSKVKGTLDDVANDSSSVTHSRYQKSLIFPRSLDSNRATNPWSQNREEVRVQRYQSPRLPKGNPWAAQSLDQLEPPKDSKDKNPYTDAPGYRQGQQNPYSLSPYEPNYRSNYSMPFNNGYYPRANGFPSPFDESFMPSNPFWSGNNGSFPFMPW